MLSSQVLVSRRAIHEQLEQELGPSSSTSSPTRHFKHLVKLPVQEVQGQQEEEEQVVLITDTAIVQPGGGITPLVAPGSPFLTTPRLGRQDTPPLTASSMGRETSMTDQPLLDDLLPLLPPGSGGTAEPTRVYMSTAACSLSLAKAILGVGVVAMPHAFLLLGAVPATLAFVGMCALTQFSCACLAAAAAATGQSSYTGILAAQLGRWAAVALDLSMLLNCFGMLVVYLIASGDTLVSDECAQRGVPPWMHTLLSSRPLVLALLTLVVLVPLLSFRRLRSTTAVSVLGMLAVVLWASATLYLDAVLALRGQAHALSPWPARQLLHERWQLAVLQVVAALPVILTAFMCQMSFFSVLREMEPPASPRRMRTASAGAISISLAVTLLLAAGSEVAFGGSIEHNVMSNFSIEAISELLHQRHAGLARVLALTVRAAYLLSVLASFPLQESMHPAGSHCVAGGPRVARQRWRRMQPMRDSVGWLMHPSHSYSSLQAAELSGWQFYALTYGTLALAYLLASQLLGATGGAMVAFILPGALAITLPASRQGMQYAVVGGTLLILLGLLLAVAGIASAVMH